MTLRGKNLVLALVALAAAGTCIRLGVWQLDRLAQRRVRTAHAHALAALPPVEIRAGVAGDSLVGRQVQARGVFDYAHERLWRPRPHQSVPGVNLVTPLRLGDGSGVWVDRGWAPSPDAVHVDQAAWRGPDTAEVRGLGVRLPRGRGDVDPTRLADSVPYPLHAVGIQLLPPRPSPTEPLPLPAPLVGNGPHLAYAVQWFSFAAIVLVGDVRTAAKGPVGFHLEAALAIFGVHSPRRRVVRTRGLLHMQPQQGVSECRFRPPPHP